MATVKDFIVECSTYEFSKTNLDILKECSEIALMEKYLENQEFLQENTDLLNEHKEAFTEGFIMEASTDGEIQEITESLKNKAANLRRNIKELFKKLIVRFVTFLKKIVGKLTDSQKIAAENWKLIQKTKLTEEVSTEIGKIIVNAYESSGCSKSIKFTKKQPGSISLSVKNAEINRTESEIKSMILAVLTTSYAKLDVTPLEKDVNGSIVGPLNVTDLNNFLKRCTDIRTMSASTASTAKSEIENAWKSVRKNGLIIYVDNKKFENVLLSLSDMAQQIEIAKKSDDATTSGNLTDLNISAGASADALKFLNDQYTIIAGAIASTTTAYSSYMAFRQSANAALNTYLKSISSAGADAK